MLKQMGLRDALSQKRSRNSSQLSDAGTPVSHSRVKVRYAETDQMGVAYYANYLVWFEVGRSQFCVDCGFSYRDMERETGLYMIVAEAYCRYMVPARYEDELTVTTRVIEVTRRTLRFGYEMTRDSDAVRVARGETLHVLMTREGKPASLADKYRKLLSERCGPARS
jgi:acyl-CoA thioester hydrolase